MRLRSEYSPFPATRFPAAKCWALFLVILALCLAAAHPAAAAEEAEGREIPVSAWLVTPASALPLPALASEEGHEIELKDLLGQDAIEVEGVYPAAGASWSWPREEVQWQEGKAADGTLDLSSLLSDAARASANVNGQSSANPRAESATKTAEGAAMAPPVQCLAAFYLSVDRYSDAQLVLTSQHLLQVYLDGEKLKDKTDKDPATVDLKLLRGKHCVIVRAVHDPMGAKEWTLAAKVKMAAPDASVNVAVDLSPRHELEVKELLDARSISGLQLSNDGELLAYKLSSPGVPRDDRKSWYEIRRTKDGNLVRSFEGDDGPSSFAWVPGAGHRYSFTTKDDKKTTLWVADLDGSPTESVLKDVEHFGSYRWLPDASAVVYTVSHKEERKHKEFKHYENLADRWATYRDRSYLYLASYPAGASHRLTAGAEATSLQDISPDSSTLIFSREIFGTTERPFSVQEFYELDLKTLKSSELFDSKWAYTARYAPDGKSIVVEGGPDAFGSIGVNLPEGVIPNDYDYQLYSMDRASGKVTALTREFDPALGSFEWSKKDNAVYFIATTADRDLLYRLDARSGEIAKLNCAGAVASRLALSRDGSTLAYVAESASQHKRIFVQEAKTKAKPRLLADPNGARFDRVELGKVEDWNFTASDGTTIIGRVYYPPNFDPKRAEKWPCIVYYYGGTVPITRDFGGRYPKNYWAANGYVIYVPEPSGATGFGQEFSARHVNDWGKRSAQDIIEGTEKFLAAHPFVDAKRVGCIGASFGGFETMYLVSHCDLYAAAVSHAGISFIGSYWGQGDWGAFYSAVATAGKYPWNAPQFYVEQGSLFNADKIHTPLLLLCGDIDNNVPPGESEQLYTALKVLGRDVDFIRIDGEQHWILRYDRRLLWSRTIVAYFDKKLKGDDRYWNHLWGTKADAGDAKADKSSDDSGDTDGTDDSN
ncbi:MAG TPA: prolyl oligopeptidase family serine peptidase [Candidatus Krumholzibacteria bacterium]|nr:prolyl oligopeptidase family serine peptidase [Candidatus Krumholzibacteria bacterium]